MRDTDERNPESPAGREAGARPERPGVERPSFRLVGGAEPRRGVAGRDEPRPSGKPEAPEPAARARAAREAQRQWAAGVENIAAAGAFSSADARWLTAMRASESIEGGRAAVLRPEVRSRLISSATRMGLRPFDASLVLAIVQDAARTGQGLEDPATVERLGLVAEGRAPGDARRARRGWLRPAVLCVVLGAIWGGVIVRWLLG